MESSLRSLRFRIPARVVRTGTEAGLHHLLHAGNGREQTLDEKFYRILCAFRIPTTLEVAQQELSLQFHPEQVEKAVDTLRSEGWLEADHPGIGFEAGRRGLFSSPLLRLEEILGDPGITDVVVGMPYDLGSSNRSGSRLGPDFLRLASPQLFGAKGANYDPVRHRCVMEGRRLADLGNIAGHVFRSNGDCFEQLSRIVLLLVEHGRRPVILGGDHSITYACVTALLERGPLQLVQFDAHSDFAGPVQGNWRDQLHHGNFVSWLLEHERLERVVQVGVRQLVADAEVHPRIVRFPGLSAIQTPWWECLSDTPIYLTIDVDCLDPSLFASTGTPLPGGFTPRELTGLIEQLVSHRRPIALDLVELIKDREIDALTACEFLLRAMDA